MFAGNPGVCSTSVNKRATSHLRVAQHLFPAHFHLIQGEFWGDLVLGTLNKEEVEVTLGKMLVFPSAKKTALRLTISFSGVQFFPLSGKDPCLFCFGFFGQIFGLCFWLFQAS